MKKIFLIALLALAAGCSKKEYEYFGALFGVVTEASTGEPVAGASVVLSPGGKTKITGTDGAFEFNDLDAQQYTVTVQKTGYSTNRKTVTVVVDTKVEGNITLTAL